MPSLSVYYSELVLGLLISIGLIQFGYVQAFTDNIDFGETELNLEMEKYVDSAHTLATIQAAEQASIKLHKI